MRRLLAFLERRHSRRTRRYNAGHHQPYGGSSKLEATFYNPKGS